MKTSLIYKTRAEDRGLFLGLVFPLDVFFTGVAQAALTLGLTAATALLGVLLTVCEIVVCHLKNYELHEFY